MLNLTAIIINYLVSEIGIYRYVSLGVIELVNVSASNLFALGLYVVIYFRKLITVADCHLFNVDNYFSSRCSITD